MRKNWKMRVSSDIRGKITTGMKVKKNGKEYPKALDYFNITAFDELIEAYGEKPSKLVIIFPSDNIDEFIQTEYSVWSTSKSGNPWKKRTCDGEVCLHNAPEKLNGTDYIAGEEHECFRCYDDDCELPERDRCKSYTGFSARVIDPKAGTIISPRPYRFQTNSDNSSDRILSECTNIFNGFGGIAGIPFILSVEMKESQVPGKDGKVEKRQFPLWDLQAHGTVAMINMYRERRQLPTREENALILDESKMITSGKEKALNPPAEKDKTASQAPPAGEVPVCKACGSELRESDKVTDGYHEVCHPDYEDDLPDDMAPGVKVNDPYPDQNEGEDSGPGIGDVLDREESVLSQIPDIDEGVDEELIVGIKKMILHMAADQKPAARKILKEVTYDPNTRASIDKTADLKPLGNTRLRAIYSKTKNRYRDFVQAIVAEKQQQNLQF